jgi:hypothetical protein
MSYCLCTAEKSISNDEGFIVLFLSWDRSKFDPQVWKNRPLVITGKITISKRIIKVIFINRIIT